MSKWELNSQVLNIYKNIDAADCEKIIQTETKIGLIQLWKSLEGKITEKTLTLINDEILALYPNCSMRFTFGDANHYCIDYKNLDNLRFLSNLKVLHLSIEKINIDFTPINKYLDLNDFGIYSSSRKIDISFLKEQTTLRKLYVGGKVSNLWILNEMPWILKLTLNQQLDDLKYIQDIKNLKELHFWGGHVSNLQGIDKIGKIEKLEFEGMRKITDLDLIPVNTMPLLKYLAFATMNNLKTLNWLTLPNVEYGIRNCTHLKGVVTPNYKNTVV